MKKRMKEIVKKHLMTLGVVVGVCGALMIIIPTCGGEEKAAEPTGIFFLVIRFFHKEKN